MKQAEVLLVVGSFYCTIAASSQLNDLNPSIRTGLILVAN